MQVSPEVVLSHSPAEDPRFAEQGPQTLEERFPPGTDVVVLRGEGRGCIAHVANTTADGSLTLDADVPPPEPPFGHTIAASIKDKFYDSRRAAEALGVSTGVLGRVTGTVLVNPGKYDIGLNLKVRRTLYLPGYVRSSAAEATKVAWGSGADATVAIAAGAGSGAPGGLGWEYTERAIQLVIAYQRAFPIIFALLETLGDEPSLSLRDIPGGEEAVLRICTWLQQLETFKRPLVPVQTLFMAPAAIAAVEKAADAFYTVMRKRAAAAASTLTAPAAVVSEPASITKAVRRTGVLPADVFRPEAGSSYAVGGVGEGHGTALGVNSVDGASCVPILGDRVANLSYRQAPLGLRGTVVAIHAASGFVEVVFDAEFVGGGSLGGLCTVGRGALVPWSALLCLSREPSASSDAPAATAGPGGLETPGRDDVAGIPRGKRGGPNTKPRADPAIAQANSTTVGLSPPVPHRRHGGGAGGHAPAPSSLASSPPAALQQQQPAPSSASGSPNLGAVAAQSACHGLCVSAPLTAVHPLALPPTCSRFLHVPNQSRPGRLPCKPHRR